MKKIGKLLVLAVATLALSSCGLLGGLGETEVGTDSLEYSVSETQSKLNKIAEANGIEIKVKYQEKENGSTTTNGEAVFGIKGNTYWDIDENGEGSAYVIKDDKSGAYVYTYADEEWSYDYFAELTGDDLASLENYLGLSGWLYFGHMYDGSLLKSGTTTIAGRTCDVYKYSINVIVEKIEYTLAIDQETGATMKYDLGASLYGESASVGFEVTSWKTSGVSAPKLPAPTEDEDNNGGEDVDHDVSDEEDDDEDYTNSNKYEKELRVTSKNDLHSVTNDIIVAKYSGTHTQLTEEDDIYIDDYGTMDIYWVWQGFYDDGSVNSVSGYTCFYYFFDDAVSFAKGLAKVPSYALRGVNTEGLYFTVSAYSVYEETYQEIVNDLAENCVERVPHFTFVA